MKVLICGSRTWRDHQSVHEAIDSLPDDTVVIEGGAHGADYLARQCALMRHLKVLTFPADWNTHGRAAGPIRNQRMLDEGKPDRVIAFRMTGPSRGTDDMIRRARKAGVPVEVIDA